MISEHHIDQFDLPAFFKLHDLDSDGFWTTDEIAALYGLRHHSVTGLDKKVPDGLEEQIVSAVLAKLDKNGDCEYTGGWRGRRQPAAAIAGEQEEQSMEQECAAIASAGSGLSPYPPS